MTDLGFVPPKNIAGAMLCAILSDTVIFKSPTCTPADKAAAAELAEIAGIEDIEALGMELFTAKSAVKGVAARDLIMRDFKDFNMSGSKVGIGQLELVESRNSSKTASLSCSLTSPRSRPMAATAPSCSSRTS